MIYRTNYLSWHIFEPKIYGFLIFQGISININSKLAILISQFSFTAFKQFQRHIQSKFRARWECFHKTSPNLNLCFVFVRIYVFTHFQWWKSWLCSKSQKNDYFDLRTRSQRISVGIFSHFHFHVWQLKQNSWMIAVFVHIQRCSELMAIKHRKKKLTIYSNWWLLFKHSLVAYSWYRINCVYSCVCFLLVGNVMRTVWALK